MPNTSTPIHETQDYRLIPLSGKNGQGLFAKVSPHRYEHLSQFRWYFSSRGYVIRNQPEGKSYRFISMHREILGFPTQHVDHIDGNRLNNIDENLRLATREQNLWNTRKPKSAECSSRFKGVYYQKKNRNWVASIRHNGKTHMIGAYDTEEDAACARDSAVTALRGEFGVLSMPERQPIPLFSPRIRIKSSKHEGVCFDKSRGKWMAFITENNHMKNLGRFSTEEEAVKARNAYVRKKR